LVRRLQFSHQKVALAVVAASPVAASPVAAQPPVVECPGAALQPRQVLAS
jgi:hypothetical protein